MRVFMTGGTGFVGGTLARLLLKRGFSVAALARPGAVLGQLKDLKVDLIRGDLSDRMILEKGMRGCEWVFHVAALYAYWGYSWEEFYQSNVVGTRNSLSAAGEAGIRRIVHTSSIAVLAKPKIGDTANEETPTKLDDLVGYYKRSKYLAEEVVREFSQKGLPVVMVNPSAPVGAGDWKPTATGRLIVDFLNGKMPAFVESHQNMVDVEDVAAGHLLAAEKGKVGERYILGGENLTLKQYLDILADVTGLPQVKVRMPYGVALAWSYVDVTLAKLIKSHVPQAVPEAVRIGKLHSYYDSSKARHELGYSPGLVQEAARKAVEWYRANGYAT